MAVNHQRRCCGILERAKRTLYWQNFMGFVDEYDSEGQFIGTFSKYSETQTARASISAAKGAAEQEMFGNLLEYDRTVATKFPLDMNENSLVWLDGEKPPDPHNYIVARKSQSGNYTVFALKRVELSNSSANTGGGSGGS